MMDTEHTYDPERARRIGVDNANILFYQDLNLEEAFSVVTRICNVAIMEESPQQVTVVLDSHSSTPTKAEVEMAEDATRAEIASSAKVTSLHLRRLVGMLPRARVALVLLCQIKDAPMAWGAGESFLAENPIRYHSSLILRTALTKTLEGGAGIRTKMKVKKNKVAPPFKECEIEIGIDGIDETTALLEIAVKMELVEVKGGGWYVYKGEKFKKREWREICEKNPELSRTLFGKCTGLLEE